MDTPFTQISRSKCAHFEMDARQTQWGELPQLIAGQEKPPKNLNKGSAGSDPSMLGYRIARSSRLVDAFLLYIAMVRKEPLCMVKLI